MGATSSSMEGKMCSRISMDKIFSEEAFCCGTCCFHDNHHLAHRSQTENNDRVNCSNLDLAPPPKVEMTDRENRDADSDPSPSKPKVSERSSRLDNASNVGLGKALKAIDKFTCKMIDLNTDDDDAFDPVVATKGTEISILAFEVANTIVKGSNLMHSLLKENITYLKDTILRSEGVQLLISNDMDELLQIAAADKREELNFFLKEVIRFGNRCKNPQWHNLDPFFRKLESELTFTPHDQLKEKAAANMKQLIALVQDTAQLYCEWLALDKAEQKYRQKRQEENASQRVNSLQNLNQELKIQRKHVKSLKKKSLWSKTFEEVVENLVHVIHYMKQEIPKAFGNTDTCARDAKPSDVVSNDSHTRLGSANLALHYANVITQIYTLMPKTSMPKISRDMLYQALPPNVKSALRSKLQTFHVNEEFSTHEIMAEMTKILEWLVPISINTTKIHQDFGWVGEWFKMVYEINRNSTGQTYLTRIQTLHHASKERTESYILDLVLWLHHLLSHAKEDNGGSRYPIRSPIRSPRTQTKRTTILVANNPNKSPELTEENKKMMLKNVTSERLTPGISKSEDMDRVIMASNKEKRLTRSSSHSSTIWKSELLQKRVSVIYPEISLIDTGTKL